jgi:hypothetical protein
MNVFPYFFRVVCHGWLMIQMSCSDRSLLFLSGGLHKVKFNLTITTQVFRDIVPWFCFSIAAGVLFAEELIQCRAFNSKVAFRNKLTVVVHHHSRR